MESEVISHKIQEQLDYLQAHNNLFIYHGWQVTPGGLYVYVLMYPKKSPNLKFMARFYYEGYPQRAPAFTFIDPQTRQEGKQFWPQQGSAFQAALGRNPPQLCIPGIREFHEILHTNYTWNVNKYLLCKVLEDIQVEMDKAYQ